MGTIAFAGALNHILFELRSSQRIVHSRLVNSRTFTVPLYHHYDSSSEDRSSASVCKGRRATPKRLKRVCRRGPLSGRRMRKTVRQVVNAPVGNPRHAGTDEGDRSLVGGKGSMVRAPRHQPEAVREIESRSLSFIRSLCPSRSLLQPRSIFLLRL